MVRLATERGRPVWYVRGLALTSWRLLQLQTARRRCVLFFSPDASPLQTPSGAVNSPPSRPPLSAGKIRTYEK